MSALFERLGPMDFSRDAGDGWSVGSLLAHLSFWDGLVLERWNLANRSGRLTPIGLDEELTDLINAAAMPGWRAVARSEVAAIVGATAAAVDELVAALPDESVAEIEGEGRPRLLDRSLHRQEHLATIEDALRS
jgi:hypothetical protein